MKLRVYLLACVTIMAFSCKKSTENAPPVTPPSTENNNTVEVLLKLTGDINTSESPLGRKGPGSGVFAKSLRDSTIYYVIVRKDNKSLYSGLFNQADSIKLKLPVTGTINVQAAAYKIGSGPGLFYYWENGLQRYSEFFGNETDISGAFLTNKMDTIKYVYGGSFRVDTLRWINLANPEDSTVWPNPTVHGEIDSYVGETTFAASTAPSAVTLSMKRYTFGIQYSAANFSSGRLIADFSNMMPVKYITPGDTVKQYLYTAHEFLQRDSLLDNAVTVKMKWEKPDGSIVALGEKTINFKRNILTKISVTIPPSGSAALAPQISETTWSGSETVGF